MKVYYIDGEFIPADKAVIPVTDLGILRGFAVCDVMRTFNGKPYLINEHIKRLHDSAERVGIVVPWSREYTTDRVFETLKINKIKEEVNIRVVITAGSSSDFFNPQDKPRMIILITDMECPPESWYSKGIKVVTYMLERSLPDAKVTSYVSASIALNKAKQENAADALYINRNNKILECTTSNLFAFIKNNLVTPKEGVLKGITRQAVINLVKDCFPVEEKIIDLEELLTADEVFISGTNKGIVPVVQVNETIIGNGLPGKKTKKIITMLEKHSNSFSFN